MAGEKSKLGQALPAAAAALLLPLLLLLLGRLIGLQGLSTLLASAGWGAEYLLLLCPALLLWAVFGRPWCVWLAEGLPALTLALVSYYKQRINGTPLELGDFSMLSGAGEIVGFALPQARLTPVSGAVLGAYTLLLMLLIVFGRRLRGGKGLRLGALGLSLLLTAAFAVLRPAPEGVGGAGPVLRLYAAWRETAARPGAQGADPAVLSAIHAQVYEADAAEEMPAASAPPEGQTEGASPVEPSPAPMPEPTEPTVIFLMSESFFDVTELPGVEYETDPLANFHALAAEGRTGVFISPTYCGGTGYVEMEVLTGICSALLRGADTLTSLSEERYRNLPCISDVFTALGYEKTFLHSYNEKLYNRPLIYDAFGFDRALFADSFPEDAETAGGFISDMALTEKILALLDAAEGTKQFIFAVSMENHQPYNAAKFGEGSASAPTSSLLDGDELALLDTFVRGTEDADAALGALAAALAGREEPVMLVFWGDHRPNLGLPDGRNVYDALGCCRGTDTEAWPPEELLGMLSTNYLVWTNYGLKSEERTESSTLLGLHALEDLGFPLTDWFRWLSAQVDGRCLMYRPRLYVDGAGVPCAAIPERYDEIMHAYAAAVSDVVYGGCTIFRRYRG